MRHPEQQFPQGAIGRRPLLVSAATATALLAIPSATGCSSGNQLRTHGASLAANLDDVRLRALAYAVLAPSAHNTQPWLLDLQRPNELDLYVDRTRLLPETDPPFRQIHISHGTFLEHLDMAARELGYDLRSHLLPAGEYAIDVLDDKPTATVPLRAKLSDPHRDPLRGDSRTASPTVSRTRKAAR